MVVTGALTLVFLIIFIEIYYETEHELNEIYDAYLVSSAGAHFDLHKQDQGARSPANISEYLAKVYKAIVKNGTVITQESSQFKEAVNTLVQRQLLQPQARFLNLQLGDQSWSFYTWPISKASNQIGVVAHNLHDRERALWEIMVTLLVPIFILFPLLLLLSVIYISRLSRKIEQWSVQLAKTSVESLEEAQIKADLPKELVPLQAEYNALLHRIEQTQKSQKTFLAHAAHEIKTPIATLKIQIHRLKNNPSIESDSDFAKIQKSVERVEALMLQLLDLQKLQNETLKLEKVPLIELIGLAYDEVQEIAKQQKVDVIFNLPDQPVAVSSNPFWLQRVLVNVLKNAILYAKSNSEVTFQVFTRGRFCWVSVENLCQGLSETEIEQIKGVFVRLDRHNGHIAGSGIGLSIVAEACEKLDIDWQIHSNSDSVRVTLKISLTAIS